MHAPSVEVRAQDIDQAIHILTRVVHVQAGTHEIVAARLNRFTHAAAADKDVLSVKQGSDISGWVLLEAESDDAVCLCATALPEARREDNTWQHRQLVAQVLSQPANVLLNEFYAQVVDEIDCRVQRNDGSRILRAGFEQLRWWHCARR